MSTMHQSPGRLEHRPRRRPLEVVRESLWMAALGVIVLFVFFAGLSGASPVDAVLGIVAVLSVAWAVHVVLALRESEDEDELARLRGHQSRRGF